MATMATRDDFDFIIGDNHSNLERLKHEWKLKLGGEARVTLTSPSLAELLTVAECCEAEVVAPEALLVSSGTLREVANDRFVVEDEGRVFTLAKTSLREQFEEAWSRYLRALEAYEQAPERPGLALEFLTNLPEIWLLERTAVAAWLRTPQNPLRLGPQLLIGEGDRGALATLEAEGAVLGQRVSELAGAGDDSLTAVLELAREARAKLVDVRDTPDRHA